MLGAHVEDELLDLALFGLDDREGVTSRLLDLPPLDIGGGDPYPPFMILLNLSASPRDTLRAG